MICVEAENRPTMNRHDTNAHAANASEPIASSSHFNGETRKKSRGAPNPAVYRKVFVANETLFATTRTTKATASSFGLKNLGVVIELKSTANVTLKSGMRYLGWTNVPTAAPEA